MQTCPLHTARRPVVRACLKSLQPQGPQLLCAPVVRLHRLHASIGQELAGLVRLIGEVLAKVRLPLPAAQGPSGRRVAQVGKEDAGPEAPNQRHQQPREERHDARAALRVVRGLHELG
eukprot:CAMPEP_0115216882 /NCGR_PEP_ID=MMETSP0270-20121206/25568_1 /TAXON_ID=71861 /ORGANISM="Scrippsiella trochoidea, Strain CCMP3099" /LENGTH=117 /DNA_ID=CAMNT_0002630735 /DNA_START=71 /DNA_END=424 /DNA_ORIENTATION=-